MNGGNEGNGARGDFSKYASRRVHAVAVETIDTREGRISCRMGYRKPRSNIAALWSDDGSRAC